jgi:DNA-binding transcriptional LysR family regulator
MKNVLRNWSDIRVFLAVVREGSTLAASRKLGVSQPTVARRIEALESETGLALFERDTRGFRPTESARSLIPHAEKIEVAASDFVAKATDLTGTHPIRITAPGYFSEQATDILSEFVAMHPGVAFEFIPSLKVLNLSEGEADIAIRVSKSEPDETLICRKLSTARWALFGGKRYAEKFGLPKSSDDLKGHRFVTFEHDDVPAYLHNWIAHRVSPDQIVMSFRVPDRGSVNPTALAGRDRGICVKMPDYGIVQTWQPYGLGLQIPLGVGDEVPLPGVGRRCRQPLP